MTIPEPSAPPGWSEAGLAGLARVFEAFAPGAAIRRARLAAGALDELAEPGDVRQLKLALRAFDSRLVNVLLGAGAVSFRDLDEPRRDTYLLGWATSRLPLRRTTFQLLKRLSLFLAYADPGADGVNPNWARIGYRPIVEPATPEPPAVHPLAVARTGPEVATALELEADVVIVGSGAGGGLVAARAAEAGRSVLVVEAGTYLLEAQLPVNEMVAYQRLYLDRGFTATADLGVAILAGATLGGGTTINWMTSLAPPEALRAAWAHEHGLEGFDGPETQADIARLRAELGVTAPETIPPKDRALIDGCAALGWEGAANERNGSGCGDCGACGFGCRRGAKRAGPRGHLATASAHGARILVDAPVWRVLVEGGRAAGVEGRLPATDELGRPVGSGRPLTVHARQVVVAAGALRTPLVLRRGGLEHPALGENLRLHPVPVVAGRLPGVVDMWSGTLQASRSLQFLAPGPAATDHPGPAHGGFVIETAPGHPGLDASAFPWEGSAAMRAFMEQLRHFTPLVALVPDRDAGRVRATRSGRARIEYRISPRDAATARRALVEMARLARAAGAIEIVALGTPAAWFGRDGAPASTDAATGERAFGAYLERLADFDFAPNRGVLFSAHQMGTARAGADPRAAACDPWGRLRRDVGGAVVPGLYVADGSLFPTASGVNPVITIMALAERVARTVLAEG